MDKCSLCGIVLKEKENDLHGFDHPYEFPCKITWIDEENFQITNKVVHHMCNQCMRKVMKVVNECIVSGKVRND